jgi:hypothetical protein
VNFVLEGGDLASHFSFLLPHVLDVLLLTLLHLFRFKTLPDLTLNFKVVLLKLRQLAHKLAVLACHLGVFVLQVVEVSLDQVVFILKLLDPRLETGPLVLNLSLVLYLLLLAFSQVR